MSFQPFTSRSRRVVQLFNNKCQKIHQRITVCCVFSNKLTLISDVGETGSFYGDSAALRTSEAMTVPAPAQPLSEACLMTEAIYGALT